VNCEPRVVGELDARLLERDEAVGGSAPRRCRQARRRRAGVGRLAVTAADQVAVARSPGNMIVDGRSRRGEALWPLGL